MLATDVFLLAFVETVASTAVLSPGPHRSRLPTAPRPLRHDSLRVGTDKLITATSVFVALSLPLARPPRHEHVLFATVLPARNGVVAQRWRACVRRDRPWMALGFARLCRMASASQPHSCDPSSPFLASSTLIRRRRFPF